MPILSAERLPKYRKHRASGQALVTLSGVDHYLGPHGTNASKREYDRLVADWLARGRSLAIAGEDITIIELLAAFRRFAVGHYRKNGKPTRSVGNFDDAIRPLKLLYGRERVADFGPKKLKAVRHLMVTGFNDPNGRKLAPLARKTVNRRIGIVKQVFKWGCSEELVPASIFHALQSVVGLQRGRTEAPETSPIEPVASEVVDATLPHLAPVVSDMVRVQRLTGCRPGEVCIVRPCDVDRSGKVWQYRPESHKTEHHGRERVIHIGPQSSTQIHC